MAARPACLLAASAFLLACSTGGPERGARLSPASGAITRAELAQEAFTSAHHAVERLRRSWLRRRGAGTPNNPDPRPSVYLDGVRIGPIEELFGISAEYVETISLLSPTEATTRFGTGHASGAIVVVTRRGPAKGAGYPSGRRVTTTIAPHMCPVP